MAEAAKVRDATRLDEFGIALRAVFLVPSVRHAKDIECLALHLRGIDTLETVLDMLVPGLNKEKLLPKSMSESCQGIEKNLTHLFFAAFLLVLSPEAFAAAISSSSCFIVSREILLFRPQNSDLAVRRLMSCTCQIPRT